MVTRIDGDFSDLQAAAADGGGLERTTAEPKNFEDHTLPPITMVIECTQKSDLVTMEHAS